MPFLSGRNIIRDFSYDYPFYATGYNFFKPFSESLKNGSSPDLWLPQIYAGFPVWLTQVGFFSPLGITLFKFFDYVLAYNWLIYLNFVLSGLAAYWLARNLNLSVASSIVAGLTYELSQLNLYWGNIPIFSNTYIFLPLLFAVILKLTQGKLIYVLWGGLLIAYGLAAGETQVVAYSLTASFAWWLFLNWQDIKQVMSFRFRVLKFGGWSFILAVILGSILASFWVVPVLNYLSYSLRTGGAVTINDLNYNFSWGDPLKYFYPFVELPSESIISPFSGIPNFYVAILSFFLAAAAVIFWRRNKFVAFFAWLFFLTYIMRIKFLGLAWLLNFIPVLNRFRTMFHWHSVSVFAIALLAGLGLEYLDKMKEQPRFHRYLNFLKFFAFFNVTVVVLFNVAVIFQSKILTIALRYFDSHIYGQAKKFPLDYYHNIITEIINRAFYSFSLANPRFLFSFIFILISIASFFIFYKGRISFSGFKALAAFIIALNLVLVFNNYYRVSPRRLIENSPDTAQFIKNNLKSGLPFRVARFYPSEMYQEFEIYTVKDIDEYNLKTFMPNLGLYFGIETPDGDDPFVPAALLKILGASGVTSGTGRLTETGWIADTGIALEEKIKRFTSKSNQEFLGFLNVKYVLSSFEFPRPWKKVFETTATERKIPVYIYENPEFIERAYLVDSQGIIDKGSRVFIAAQYNPQYVKIKTINSKDSTLVFSQMNLPTWLAFIDGKSVNLLTHKDLFMSLEVPAGEHEIEFIYPGLWEQFKLAAARLL